MTLKKVSTPQDRTILRGIFEGFLNSLGFGNDSNLYELLEQEGKATKRAMALDRIYQQIYMQLRDRDEWAYPLSLYVENNSMFCTVAQGGMIFQVPLTISKDSVGMGDWVRVEETFTPVVEQSFRIRRQKDGKYRWTCIAGTTVLNRVGEIDSSELFDSFVEHAERTGEYPRLDFYHHGEENPEAWEFGTADFLTREGVCYIASGTFDEDHPLARATIKACERDGDIWGNSVEFRATVKSELIVSNPEIKVAVYKRGINTRISVVLEEDAAGLFTLYGVEKGVTQTMDAKTREKLTALYGGDEAGLQAFLDQFEENVDGVNRTVKDDNLIHRAKDSTKSADPGEGDEDEGEEDEDEMTVDELVAEVVQSKEIVALIQGVANIQKMMGDLIVEREKEKAEREKDKQEITRLNTQVTDLSKDETEKKQEYLQDLPRSKRTHISHRPREMHDALEGSDRMDTIANRTLNGIPAASRY